MQLNLGVGDIEILPANAETSYSLCTLYGLHTTSGNQISLALQKYRRERESRVMVDAENDLDERATILATRALELVGTGHAEVEQLSPSKAYDAH